MPSSPTSVIKNRPLIPLSVPQLGGNAWTYLKECLDTGWVSSAGPFVKRFEDEMANIAGTSYAVAFANGTSALHIALKIVGVRSDDLVLVSDLTFVAPVNAIRYCGARPVFIDADKKTWQMDPVGLENFLEKECQVKNKTCVHQSTGRTVRAILPVHILGLACDMDKIMSIAKKFHLVVVEDAAEAVGVRYNGKHAGTLGDVGVFSFNGNKIVTSGGGGILVTKDKKKAEWARHLSTQARVDEIENIHDEVGYNYRITNIQAALGLSQLERLSDHVRDKNRIATAYQTGFKGNKKITPHPTPSHTKGTFWLYTILFPASISLPRRKKIGADLQALGIQTRPFWHPMHGLRPYNKEMAYKIEGADELYRRGLCLPSSVGLSDDDLAHCIASVKNTLSRYEFE